ncbi:hypothetical protein KSP40_PGU001995 [Platanthera guangdongensis]|uniref:Uncharacterized protein n=1 Tax=Platanthera guangdongensis TaxID=2320717 RepID=A0ABR2M164_9ASPA
MPRPKNLLSGLSGVQVATMKARQRIKDARGADMAMRFLGRWGMLQMACGRDDKKTRPKKAKKIERIKDRIEVPRSTSWPLPFKLI